MDVIEPGSSGRAETDALVEGPKWVGTTITFSFPALAGYADYGGVDEVAKNFEAFNAVQQAAVRTILGQISSFTGLTFVELSGTEAGNATLRFAMSDEPETAYAMLPNPSSFGGDAWFNNSSGEYDNPAVGNYAWMGLLHEIGHALGLGHPHESDPPLDQHLDWMAFTVMSYRSVEGSAIEGYTNENWSFAQSFMSEDLAALQFLYGANFGFRSDDTTYSFDHETGELFVNGITQGVPGGQRSFFTLWDGGGTDTFDFSSGKGDVDSNGTRIDLRPGMWSTFEFGMLADLNAGNRAPGNFANPQLVENDPRSLIENVIGSRGPDVIYGNAANNVLIGNDGNDEIYGFEGDDTIEGGAGLDWLYGLEGNDLIRGGAEIDNIYGGSGADAIFGDEGSDNLFGEAGDDTLLGGAGNDALLGGDGDDELNGGPDSDALDGGNGNDRLIDFDGDNGLYGGEGNDTLTTGAGNDILEGGPGVDTMTGGAGDDTYYIDEIGDRIVELPDGGNDSVVINFSYVLPQDIENAEINIYVETAANLTGNASANRLLGNVAANIIDGGGGADHMEGRGGDDTYFVDDPGDVVLDYNDGGFDTVYASVSYELLSSPEIADPYGGASVRRDTYEVEQLILTGTGNLNAAGSEIDNILRGNPGNNILSGRAGNDTLIGVGGRDSFIGGEGIDTVVFTDETGPVVIDLVTGAGASASDGDTFESIENIIATAFDDRLIGNSSDNTFTGHLGADTLIGGPGIDTASYAGDEGGVFVNLTLGRGYGNASFGDTYDSIENVIGTDYNDFIIGDPGTNRLDGAGGDDTIIGAVGPDEIIGGTGLDWASYEDNSGTVFVNLTLAEGYNNAAEGDTYSGIENLVGGLFDDFFIGDENANRLAGAMGADTLLGAGGADVFMFTYAPGAPSGFENPNSSLNVDLILDFTTGEDKIELSAGAFPGLAAGALPTAAFHAGTAAHDDDDRIVYDAASGKLWFDPDGTGAQAAMLFATLGETSHPAAIAASDFVVV